MISAKDLSMQFYLSGLDSANSSSFTNQSDATTLLQLLNTLKLCYTPAMIGVGIVSNLLISVVLNRGTMPRVSVTPYLHALALVDVLFLITLMLFWLQTQGIDLYNKGGGCQTLTYISHVCTFLSVWYFAAIR